MIVKTKKREGFASSHTRSVARGFAAAKYARRSLVSGKAKAYIRFLLAAASASFEKKRLALAEVCPSAIKSFRMRIRITSKDGRPLAGSGKKS